MLRQNPLDVLSVYNAQAVRVDPVDGEPDDLVGEGGGLIDAWERLGRAPLLRAFVGADIRGVVLADGDVEVHGRRDGSCVQVEVIAAGQTIASESVALPTASATHAGPWFRPDTASELSLDEALADLDANIALVADIGGRVRCFSRGWHGPGHGAAPLRVALPPLPPDELGARVFRERFGVRMAYVAGAMAGGIASVALVSAMARSGLLAFFGSGGLPEPAVEAAAKQLAAELGDLPWGMNLLHNPAEPAVELATVATYLAHRVRFVEASAFMTLTPAIVWYRAAGLSRDASGRVVSAHRVFAKVSRTEVAERFLRPAPAELLAELVADGRITAEQAALAAELPMADAITAEGDSGGHTDHRPLLVLLPILRAQRDRIAAETGVQDRTLIGAAGGLGTPDAIWAAFALGADYVLTGSVNQACREAGTSPEVKQMLAEAAYSDVASGPAPDMFELGAKVQVLSRGAMYAQRAQKLYELYRTYGSLDALPAAERTKLEKQIFLRPLDEVWAETASYWSQRDPTQLERAQRDPRHQLALTFRWYLGMTSRWARQGDPSRKRDYQIWCGPSIGGFNHWTAGGPLATPEARGVVEVAERLMHGAAVCARRAVVKLHGVEA